MESLRARQAEVLRRVLESERVDLHTGLPGKIRSYDPDSGTAEIEIQIRRVLPSGDDTVEDQTEELPILPGVPVLLPRATATGGYLSIEMGEGDGVWILFSEADLNQWRATGEVSDPGVSTRHGLSGAFAVPGAFWRGNHRNAGSGVRLGIADGPEVKIEGSTIEAGGANALALAADVKAHLSAISAALATIAGLLSPPATSSYVYATVLAASPIETSVTKGA